MKQFCFGFPSHHCHTQDLTSPRTTPHFPRTGLPANPSASPQAELAARVSNLEKRLGEQEVRTRSLESKLDAGFDKVLSQLATLRAPAAPAPGP